MSRSWSVLGVLAVIGGGFACGGGGGDGGGGPGTVVSSVVVSPARDTLTSLGATQQFTATAKDGDGAVVSGRPVTWNSSAPGVATITQAGLVTAVAEGTTSLSATVDGAVGTAVVVVKIAAPVGGTIQGTISYTNSFAIRALALRPFSRLKAARGPALARTPVTTTKPQVAWPRTPVRELSSPRVTSVPGELLVTFKPQAAGLSSALALVQASPLAVTATQNALRAAVSPVLNEGQATLRGVSPVTLTARIQVAPGANHKAVAAQLRALPNVAAVTPNYRVYPMAEEGPSARLVLPNDPLYALQAWHYSMISLPQAWTVTTGSAAVLVAVVDNGIRFDHPGISANLTNDGYDFVSDLTPIPVCGSATTIPNSGDGNGVDADPTNPLDVFLDQTGCISALNPSGNHGLHVAGTIGARGNDGSGVTGVNWTVRIRPVRVLGLAGGSNYDVAQGLLYAAGLPADNGAGGTVTAPSRAAIINMSLGGPGNTPELAAAVTAASNAGSLIVVAAGNTGDNVPQYPASYPEVISVSAVGPDGFLASYSSFGPTVDLTAPGGDIQDGGPDFGIMSTAWNYATNQAIYDNSTWNGTSMAAPHVSGIAALMLAASPGLTAAQLRSRLENTALDLGVAGVDQQYGHGLVNAYSAITQTAGPPAATRVFLYDAATGAQVANVVPGSNGRYSFTGLAPGQYRVYAGQDELADGLVGRPLRRWGAFGGAATPTTIVVSGTVSTTADFTIGIPLEAEANDNVATADPLPMGGYLAGFFAAPATDVDVARVDIPVAGTYTFETMPLAGACGFALEEDTILELLSAGGTSLAVNDDINTNGFNLCSRITIALQPGTYFLKTTAFSGPGASGIPNRRYAITARAGT